MISTSARLMSIAARGPISRAVRAAAAPAVSVGCRERSSRASTVPRQLPDEVHADPWHIRREKTTILVQDIKTEDELNKLLTSAKPEALVVVKYYSSKNNASKEIEERYEQTAIEFNDMLGPGSIHFAHVNLDNSKELSEEMGIESIPHVQIFAGNAGKIAEFSIAPSKYDTLPSLLTERREAAMSKQQ